eukprot:4801506-Pyramimonas_sp.AAC.1
MAVAEQSNGIVQMGTRALLMQAGLPPPFWTYAVRYSVFATARGYLKTVSQRGSADSDMSLPPRFL